MALVAWVSYRAARREADTQEGYFLAGRGLGALFIAGSMLLTNLSAEQLVGLNGSAYGYNLSSIPVNSVAKGVGSLEPPMALSL